MTMPAHPFHRGQRKTLPGWLGVMMPPVIILTPPARPPLLCQPAERIPSNLLSFKDTSMRLTQMADNVLSGMNVNNQ